MKYEDKSGNRAASRGRVERPGFSEPQSTIPPRPNTGRMAAPPKNSSWNLPWIPKPKARASRDEVDDFKRRAEQKAAEEKEKQRQEMASWEGAAGEAARQAYIQAVLMGRSEAEAFYYAQHVKKICDELPEDTINAVLEDVNTNHNGDILSYFFLPKEQGAVNFTEGDPNRGAIVTVYTTELERFLRRHNDTRISWKDIEMIIGLTVEVGMLLGTFYYAGKTVVDILQLLKATGEITVVQKLIRDTDGNGTPDIFDLADKNKDGAPDIQQQLDKNGDGELDVKQILDKNNNGVPDALEVEEEVFEYTISENKLHHIEKHTLESIVEQSKYLDDGKLANKLESSFFSPEWSVEETRLYVQEAYNDLRTQGITGKKVSYQMHGEIIEIVFDTDGSFATAYGNYHFTVEEIRELARRL